jgi:hypothetical protein
MVGGAAWVLVPGVPFLATLIRPVLGFGEALVAVPLLASLIRLRSAGFP